MYNSSYFQRVGDLVASGTYQGLYMQDFDFRVYQVTG